MRTLVILLCCSGCAVFMPAPTPMTSLRDELPGNDAKCLVVFLPGPAYLTTHVDAFLRAFPVKGKSKRS